MIISSRTPEGLPNRCSLCGKTVCVEPSDPTLDGPCPHCGQLLWWSDFSLRSVRDHLCEKLGVNRGRITADASFIDDLGMDSLDIAEFVMDIEEEFDIRVHDEDVESIKTVGDAVKYVEGQVRGY